MYKYYSKNNHCKCGKLITNVSKQCQNCYIKSFKGNTNPNYKIGKYCNIHFCKDNCGNIVSRRMKRCPSCCKKRKNLSLKTRKKLSISRSTRNKGRNNPVFSRLNFYSKRIKYKNIWFRSSYEYKYAKYLDKNHIKWLYEPKTFKVDNYTYTPDFYLPKTEEYIEIKGYLREENKLKYKLFKKIYPKIRWKMLMKLELENLGVL